jgi:hypothetical protein
MKHALRVHIIPVADDDVDRIVKPANIGKADKIYLIRHSGQDIFKDIFSEAKEDLISHHIVHESDLIEIECDYYDFTSLLQKFAEIIRKEQQMGNFVYFNVSTGGKLNSLTGMLACLIFGGTPYFCKKDFIHDKIPENPEILEFPRYHIERPNADLIRFLKHLDNYMTSRRIQGITKGECINLLKRIDPGIDFSGKTSGDYNKLKFRYLDKLASLNFIEVEPRTRGKVKITEEGKFAMAIFSSYYDIC